MRVLVTGGRGFVGRAVVAELLAHGHDVLVLARPGAAAADLAGVPALPADPADRAAMTRLVAGARLDGVCHLAARTRVREAWTDPIGYHDVNLGGTANLLAALTAAAGSGAPARFVLASTAAVYGSRGGRLREGDRTDPVNAYGASKLAAERLVAAVAATGALAAVSLRCFNVAGAVGHPDPDTTRVVAKALAVAAGTADRLQVNGDGSALRDYTHVADVATAYRLALESAVAGQHLVLNVGTGAGTSVTDVVRAVQAVTGRPVRTEHLPPAAEAPSVLADCTRIRERLGWRPVRSDLDRIVADGWSALAVS